MIDIKRKQDCVGCEACIQICPKQCIEFTQDVQGFFYPKVNTEICINCGLCERVCPVIHQNDPKNPLETLAAWNKDDKIRMSSSSGGVFYTIAEQVIKDGGIVFGASFNDSWEVVHSHADTIDGITKFQGSKYTQSKIGNSYKDAEHFLKQGRKVLFSGTPCQIAGLKRLLRKDYGDLLLTVDVVCHGVPSPGIWKEYLNSLTRPKGALKNTEYQSTLLSMDDISSIEDISFRDKRLGWEKFGISIHYAVSKGVQNSESQSTIGKTNVKQEEFFQPFTKNIFMQGFLKDLYLRPSCYECPAKCGKSHSDITLADFWGIRKYKPDLYSEKGVSLIMVNTDQAQHRILNPILEKRNIEYSIAFTGNPAIEKSAIKPKTYIEFWKSYHKEGIEAIRKTIVSMRPTLVNLVYGKMKKAASRIKKFILLNH